MLNTKARTRTFMRGIVTINMDKLDEVITIATYIGLYIANKLLVLGCLIACIMTAAAGGDGKHSDGSAVAMILFLSSAILCGFAARFTSIMMKNIVKSVKKNRNRK